MIFLSWNSCEFLLRRKISLAAGNSAHGTGSLPNEVVYNDGVQDVLVWRGNA
jgi:hypothetical protein